MADIFEQASRNKNVRFQVGSKKLMVEDMWNMSPEDIDIEFKKLNRQFQATQEESLLTVKSAADKTLELKVAILRHIVRVLLAEEQERKTSAMNQLKDARRAQHLMDGLERKEERDVDSMSATEIQAELAELAKKK